MTERTIRDWPATSSAEAKPLPQIHSNCNNKPHQQIFSTSGSGFKPRGNLRKKPAFRALDLVRGPLQSGFHFLILKN
jgi:hypothetical protein